MNSLDLSPLALIAISLACEPAALEQVSAATPVMPIDYRVGPIPVPYQPFDYTAYPYTPGSIDEITDSSLQTFTALRGLDGVLQPNGALVDTGTFYLLQYQIDPQAVSFRIDFTARIDDYPTVPFGDFQILALSPDGVISRPVVWQVTAREPTTFGVEFFRDGNSGNFVAGQGVGLDSMITQDGRVRVVLNGVFGATGNEPGAVNTYLYDVSAFYAVPEPSTMVLLAFSGLFASAAMWVRTRRLSQSRHQCRIITRDLNPRSG